MKVGPPEFDNPDRYDAKASPPRRAPVTLPKLSSSFPDGTSTTLLFAEKYSECNWYRGGSTPIATLGGNLWAWPGDNAWYAPAFAMESPWNDGTHFQIQPSQLACNVAYPSSGHVGSMVVAFADGSTRNLSPSISDSTWIALCTPNGGDQPGKDF